MSLLKPSLFTRLLGSDDETEDTTPIVFEGKGAERHSHAHIAAQDVAVPEDGGGELAVDIYQTPDALVVKALIAGIQPTSVDIALTREMVTISGVREDEREVEEENYFQRELYWGSFARTILLPAEVEVEEAEALEKHGLLVIRLPKIDKDRTQSLKVKSV